MILVCPFCGTSMSQPLSDGLSACAHCGRVFSSCLFNKLLSASWLVRNYQNYDVGRLVSDVGLSEPEAILVYSFVAESGYSHDELIVALKSLSIS